jgi:hypothetical protein
VDRVPQGQRHLQHLTPQKTAQADPSKQPNIESDRTDWEVSDTYTTDGDVLKMQLDSIGETWGFRWSLHRGTLKLERDETLGAPPELAAPTPLPVHPWERIG